MSPFKLTSIAAALVVASTTALAKSPDQRAIEYAQSVADRSAVQQPKAAASAGNGSILSALQTVLSSLVKKEGTQ